MVPLRLAEDCSHRHAGEETKLGLTSHPMADMSRGNGHRRQHPRTAGPEEPPREDTATARRITQSAISASGTAAVPDRRPTGIADRAAGILAAIAVDDEDACASHCSEPMLVRRD
jgi:hypothetical protein